MKAVVYRGAKNFKVEQVPEPQLQHPGDVVVKVKYSGICGTDLHTYRGFVKVPDGQILGHEFVGIIDQVGEGIKNFSIGDTVVSTFTIQCGECWYCEHGKSGQCDITNTFGKKGLPGGQAEYVRVPYAEKTLVKVDLDVCYVMMADIFTTGYYGVKKIANFDRRKPVSDIKILQLGLGPVGLCALYVFKYLGFTQVTCVDNVPDRLQKAKDLGFKAVNFDSDEPLSEYDHVLEVVGSSSALETGFKHIRRDGLISSLGMGHEPLPFSAMDCYLKNINLSFGRCHSWSLFPEALEVFNSIKPLLSQFIDKIIPIDDAELGYELFDSHKVNKVVIEF